MEAGGLFQPVADGEAKSRAVGTLRPDGGHVRRVEGAQRIKNVLRLRELVAARAEPVNDVSREERRELVEADHAVPRADLGKQPPRARTGRAGDDRDGRLRRIMAVLHARCAGPLPRRHLLRDRLIHRHLAEHGAQLLERQPARAQQARRRTGQVDDGRFHAHTAGAAVHHAVDPAVHVLADVRGGRTARAARGVGARRGDRNAGGRDDRTRHRVIGAAHPDGVQPAGGDERHAVRLRQYHRQRPGPEAPGKAVRRLRHILAVAREPARVWDMQDERVILRAALGLKNVPHGVRVQSVRAEAVDRLGRDGEQPAAAQNVRGLFDRRALPRRIGDGKVSGVQKGSPFCASEALSSPCSRAAFLPAPAWSARQ